MTLDIKKYFTNLIEKEAKISHFQMKVQTGKTSNLKPNVAATIKAEFGDIYLEDADYLVFFTRKEGWTSENVKDLFNLVNRALGKDANKLSQSDFNKFPSAAPAELPNDEDSEDVEPEQPTTEETQKTLFLKITLK